MILLIFSVVLAIGISAACSLLEAALLSLTPSQVAVIQQKSPKIGEICRRFKRNIEQPIAVILICNTAAHTIGAAVAGSQFGELFGANWLWVFSLAFTLIMVQYTEILPKTLGVRFNIQVMLYSAELLSIMAVALRPLIVLIHWINRPFERHTKAMDASATQEISALAALARSSRQITTRQEQIINAVPLLSRKKAREVMLPVENISFLSDLQTLSEAINWTGTDFHTRYPVCKNGNPDQVLGYVNFKEVVATYRHNKEKGQLIDILRPLSVTDPEESAAMLLERFVTQRCHMAIVRDPHTGKTLGLATLEDIMEELLGDLDDEFDPLPRTFYAPGEGVWVIGGGIPLTLLSRETRLPLPKRTEPVAIWFAKMLKRKPRIGDVFRTAHAEFYVRKVRRGQVMEFTLKRIA